MRALNMGTSPAPENLSATAGATIQARMAMGRAAAAQTARIPPSEYCLTAA